MAVGSNRRNDFESMASSDSVGSTEVKRLRSAGIEDKADHLVKLNILYDFHLCSYEVEDDKIVFN
jgi:hypothetical protein